MIGTQTAGRSRSGDPSRPGQAELGPAAQMVVVAEPRDDDVAFLSVDLVDG